MIQSIFGIVDYRWSNPEALATSLRSQRSSFRPSDISKQFIAYHHQTRTDLVPM
jgi:hypothetical protein